MSVPLFFLGVAGGFLCVSLFYVNRSVRNIITSIAAKEAELLEIKQRLRAMESMDRRMHGFEHLLTQMMNKVYKSNFDKIIVENGDSNAAL
jgi:hypothetical protein